MTKAALPARGVDVLKCMGKANVLHNGLLEVKTLCAHVESITKDDQVGSLLAGSEGDPRDKAHWFDVIISGRRIDAYGRLCCDRAEKCRLSLVGTSVKPWDHNLLKINNANTENLVICIVTVKAVSTENKIGLLAINNSNILWETECFTIC